MPVIPDAVRDLLDGQFATLATVGPDGRPQLTEVWFLKVGAKYGADLRTRDKAGETRVKVIIRPVRVNVNGA